MKVKLIFIFILSAGIAPAQYPTANFSMSSYTVCVNGCISCMDLSVAGADPITAWDWTFQAGTPPVSTSQNPSNICYSTAGTYTITLIVTDLNGRSDTAQQIITVQTCSGINEFADNNAITIYPNPSGGIVMLQSAEKNSAVEILNVLGEKVYSLNHLFRDLQIDISSQPNGIYFLQIETNRGLENKKIIIQR